MSRLQVFHILIMLGISTKGDPLPPTYIFTVGGAEELENWAPIYYYIFNHQCEIYGSNWSNEWSNLIENFNKRI